MVTIYPVPVLSSNISRLDPWYSLSTLHAMCFDGIDFLQTPRRIGPCVKYSPTAYQIELLPARALNKPSVHPVSPQSLTIPSKAVRCAFCHLLYQIVGSSTWDGDFQEKEFLVRTKASWSGMRRSRPARSCLPNLHYVWIMLDDALRRN